MKCELELFFSECEQSIPLEERVAVKLLIHQLIQADSYYEVRHNCFLVCPIYNGDKISPPLRDANRRPFKAIKPDIFLPHFGVVIEIDGDCHTAINTKAYKDLDKITLLNNLEIPIYSIQSEDVWQYIHQNNNSVIQNIKSFVNSFKRMRSCLKQRSRISKLKKNLTKYSKLLSKDKNYRIFNPSSHMISKDIEIPGNYEIRDGGLIYKP